MVDRGVAVDKGAAIDREVEDRGAIIVSTVRGSTVEEDTEAATALLV